MKKLIIFGSGAYGEKAIKLLQDFPDIVIECVCDNNYEKWGTFIQGYEIYSPEKAFSILDASGILVAMKEQNEVYEQCKRKTSIPVYTSFDQVIGELVGVALTVIIDITSGCNAKCLYCATGMENRINSQHDYKFLSLKNFQKIYDHLISKGLM